VGLKVYLDTCIVIYIVEKHHIYSAQIENLMKGLSQTEYFISPLTQLESMIMPLRTKDLQLQKLFEMFLNAQTFLSIPKQIYGIAANFAQIFQVSKHRMHFIWQLHNFTTAMNFGQTIIGSTKLRQI